jgi:hypothetical protein
MQTLEIEAAQAAPPVPAEPKHAFPLGRWTVLATASVFRNPFTKAPKPKQVQAAVQTEFRIDAIKPVRNDLSDCDLEIVAPAELARETSARELSDPAPEAAVEARPASTDIAWERIKSQFLGAGKP